MNFTYNQNNSRLFARNEGKIKSYESCIDVRAWSHDVRVKDRHLRDWMKADMPFCILPSTILASFLKTMTCRSRRRVTPRCHPDCKTKALLESVCNSCQAIREFLKENDSFESYFIEEELETSHWPCDRCLEALKSIKMFWKIIINKIFNFKLSKHEEFSTCEPSSHSVRSVAKIWQSEITEQAYLLKKIMPFGRNPGNLNRRNQNVLISDDISYKPIRIKNSYTDISDSKTYVIEPTDSNVIPFLKAISKGTTVILNDMVDVGCNPCVSDVDSAETRSFKQQVELLRNKNYLQMEEIETLRKENTSLKLQLNNVYKSTPWKASFYKTDNKDSNDFQETAIPEPFETNYEDNYATKQFDSEMIITMKNCRNQSFKHVSFLQVLHKTNERVLEDVPGCNSKHEDPIKILTKVKNTFGAIVKREINIVNEKRHRSKRSDMETAVIHRIRASKSVPSCSTVSSQFSSSEQDYIPSNDST